MIDPKELMIGDWVSTPIGVAQVSELHHSTVIVDKNISAFYEVVKPIPLTDEMLLLNGFQVRITSNKWFWKANFPFNIISTDDSSDPYDVTMDSIIVKVIFYVHELQNLLRTTGLKDFADNFKLE